MQNQFFQSKRGLMNTVYTLGYSGWTPQAIKTTVDGLGALLVDIRYSARSRRPEWQKEAIRNLWGPDWMQHYVHWVALGNRNYKNGGAIEIAASEIGVTYAQAALQHRPIVLMCGCKDVTICHRAVVADLLAERLGVTVVHLEAPRR